ncbi:hypothetical protein OSB04_004692, partial [Centaurea solstitialis]
MATSAFKSTTRRAPIGTSDESPASSSSSKLHRRSRSLSRFSRPIPEDTEPGVVLPTPRRKFVNTVRGSDFPEISLDDLAIEFFSGKENSNSSEVEEDESGGSSRNVKPEISPATTSFQRRSRSVSRHHNGGGSGVCEGAGATETLSQRRGRSVSRRNDGNGAGLNGGGGGTNASARVVANGDLRRRRSVSVARYQISDSESDIDHSRSSANQPKSRNINNGNTRVASFQRPTASSHRRLRSMSQTPQLRSHDGYSSQSSALTDDDSRDARHGRKEIEKTIRAVYAQKKIDHPTGDDVNHGLYEAMRKELRSAVNEIMIELEQTMERKPSALSVHDRLHSNKSDGLQMVSTTRKNFTTKLKQPEKRKQDHQEQQGKDGYKIVREVLPEPKNTANAQRVSHPRKRSNDRSRVSKRLNEEAEKYFEDFISNIEDTDFSSFDGERSDTSSTLAGTTKQRDGGQNGSPAGCNSLPVEMEGINLPWLKWDANDGSPPTSRKTMPPPTTPKTKLWDPAQALELIQDEGSGSSQGSWNPENDSRSSSKKRDMDKYMEIERSEKVLFDNWRERSMIRSGGLLLCSSSNI